MNVSDDQPSFFSHDGLRRTTISGESRWSLGYLALADGDGRIRISRDVAEALCSDHHQLRSTATAEAYAAGGFYEDAIADTDRSLPRIYLDRDHLVCDARHVDGDYDAIRSTEPDPDGLYRIGLGVRWYPVRRRSCDTIRSAAPPGDPATGYSAYVGCFTDSTDALLDLATRAQIAVAWMDRTYIEADFGGRLTDDEWSRIAFGLDTYDEHVSYSESNALYLDQIFRRAGVRRYVGDIDEETAHG